MVTTQIGRKRLYQLDDFGGGAPSTTGETPRPSAPAPATVAGRRARK